MSTVAQIQAQNAVFQQALTSGTITQDQYNSAMAIQNANMAKAQAAPPVAQSPYSAGVGRSPTTPLGNPAVTPEVSVTPAPTTPTPAPKTSSLLGTISSAISNAGQAIGNAGNTIYNDISNIGGKPFASNLSIVNPVGEKSTTYTKQVIVPLTLEQIQERDKEIADVTSYPSSNEEALALGAPAYIPLQDKINYIKQINSAYPAGGLSATLFTRVTTPTKNPLSAFNNPPSTKALVAEAGGIAITAAVAPEIVIPSIAIGEGANIGIQSATKSFATGQASLVLPASPKEVLDVAAYSAAFGIIGAGALGAIGEVAPQLAGDVANPIVRAATRISLNAGLGAGGNAILSLGNSQAIIQGAEFGAAFGAAGEVVGAVGGKIRATDTGQRVIGTIRDNIIGVKFEELTSVKELSAQNTFGKETIIGQLTEPDIETVTLRGKDVSYYKEYNLKTLQNPVVDLAGTEKVYQPNMEIGGKELEPIPILRQVESIRKGDPLLAALERNGNYKLAIAKTGNVNDFLETPSDMPAIQRTKVTIDLTKGQPPAVYAEKTIVTSEEAILPETKISFRDFTGVKIRGIPDEVNVADIAKSLPEDLAQNIYKQLGGNYRPIVDYGSQAPKDLSGAMQTGSNKFFKNAAEDTSLNVNAPDVTKLIQATTEPKEVALPRAIIGEAKLTAPKFKISGFLTPHIFSTQADEEETSFLVYPNSGLASPKIIASSITQTRNILGVTQRQGQEQSLIPTFNQRQSQIRIPTITPITKPVTIAKTMPSLIPVQIPKITPFQIPRTTPITIAKTTPILIPKLTPTLVPRQIPRTVPTSVFPKFPNVSKQTFPKMPAFGLGGGFDNLGPKNMFGGKWYLKKHKIKTYSQMLKTFGVGGMGKPMRNIEKNANKMIKAFKPKQATKQRRKQATKSRRQTRRRR